MSRVLSRVAQLPELHARSNQVRNLPAQIHTVVIVLKQDPYVPRTHRFGNPMPHTQKFSPSWLCLETKAKEGAGKGISLGWQEPSVGNKPILRILSSFCLTLGSLQDTGGIDIRRLLLDIMPGIYLKYVRQ